MEYHLHAVERDFHREREREQEASESLDWDLLCSRFAPIKGERLRVRLLLLGLESESEEEEARSESESSWTICTRS